MHKFGSPYKQKIGTPKSFGLWISWQQIETDLTECYFVLAVHFSDRIIENFQKMGTAENKHTLNSDKTDCIFSLASAWQFVHGRRASLNAVILWHAPSTEQTRLLKIFRALSLSAFQTTTRVTIKRMWVFYALSHEVLRKQWGSTDVNQLRKQKLYCVVKTAMVDHVKDTVPLKRLNLKPWSAEMILKIARPHKRMP